MADAGYTFDFEKKELKKIVTPIFRVGDIINKKHNSDINKFGQFTITDITGGKYWYNDRIICDITEQDDWELIEQNPAWSEEDEKNSLEIKCLIGSYRTGADEYRLDLWIDGLKNRVQPKEWGEDDDTTVDNLVWAIANDRVRPQDREDYCDWLKSLKDRYTWKPSEEQIKICKEVYSDLLSAKGYDVGTINSELNRLEEQLKKLIE